MIYFWKKTTVFYSRFQKTYACRLRTKLVPGLSITSKNRFAN